VHDGSLAALTRSHNTARDATAQVEFVEFEYGSGKLYWSSAMGAERRSLGGTVAWLARMGYTCFMEAGADLAPISAPCWHASFERNGWSNVLCAHSDAALRLLRGMVAEGVARRRASVSTASRGRGLRATPPLADVS
jgi:hypothetical protein